MQGYPEENDLLSLFECEPILLDSTEKDIPFFYNEATFQFSNQEEDFIVIISPSHRKVKIQVTHRASAEVTTLLDLRRVDHFEIIADKRNRSRVLLRSVDDDFSQTIEIDFKPRFKLIVKEHSTN